MSEKGECKMGDYNGVQKALIVAGGQATRPNQGGSPVTFSDTYELNSIAADSTIALCGKLPANMMIVGINVVFDALGAGVTLDIGDSDDADRYVDGLDVSSAGQSNAIAISGMQYSIGTNSGDNQLVATVLGAAATGTLKVTITGVM